ncbi:MAG: Flp pilus assembly protein CpaB [Hyphomicrobiales bacterium]|nr:MAG: Flp pilus assembly protein CpaB [Hyphomicrobiales bacterium]
MKIARLAVLGVAVAAAGGAFFLAGNLTNKEPEVREVVQNAGPRIELAEVLVAIDDIALGSSLKPKMVKWQQWPKDALGKGYIVRSETPKGIEGEVAAIARSTFFAGEPIRENKLVRSNSGYMSAILPAGMRAIATTISTETGAGGFVLPNDRVDVIMTRRGNEDQGGEFSSEVILENIRVLAIDQLIEEKDNKKVVVGKTATLQLTPTQVKILTVAQQMSSRLTLSLRSLADSNDGQTKGAEHLLTGTRGKGRVRIVKFGQMREVIAGQTDDK